MKEYGLWIFQYSENRISPPHKQNDIFRAYGYYIISHLLEGKGWYCDKNGNSCLMNEGDCVLVPAGLEHGYGGLDTNYREDGISFSGSLADSLFASGLFKTGVTHLGNIRKLLFIIEAARVPTVSSQFDANLKLINFIHELYFQQNTRANDYKSSQRVSAVIEEVTKNPKNWWRINEMAEIANLSISQFRRIFREETGLTPKQYLINLKIKSITEELNNKDCLLQEIAAEYGFKDFSHFSRLFKSQTGYSPSVYHSVISNNIV